MYKDITYGRHEVLKREKQAFVEQMMDATSILVWGINGELCDIGSWGSNDEWAREFDPETGKWHKMTIKDFYCAVTRRMAEIDFERLCELCNPNNKYPLFVDEAFLKCECERPEYYSKEVWYVKDDRNYYCNCHMGKEAMFENLWKFADGMGLKLDITAEFPDEEQQ